MLNRLIIAVFGIAIVFALSSNALADARASYVDEPLGEFNLNHPKQNDEIYNNPHLPVPYKIADEVRERTRTSPLAPPSHVYFCDLDESVESNFFFITVRADRLLSTRFEADANFDCTLKVANIQLIGDLMKGTPDARVYLYEDDGLGFPGVLLDSADISNADLVANTIPEGYAAADFSAAGWVFSDGAKYHIAVGVADQVVGDTLAPWGDDAGGPRAGEEVSNIRLGGTWVSILAATGGAVDIIMDMTVEKCCREIPFSDCYTQSFQGFAWFSWRAPHPVFGDSAFAQRFDVGGPETLVSVDVAIHDAGDGNFGNDNVYITIYDDDGFGFPGAQLAQVTLPPGSYAAFPTLTNVPFGLVLENTFHVAFSSSGTPGVDYERIISDDGSFGVGRSTSNWGPGDNTWYTMLFGWGVDVNFFIDANLCRDEFADCVIQDYYAGGETPERFYPIPEPNNGNSKWAQKFTNAPNGAECELRQLVLRFARHPDFDPGRPLMYTHNTFVRVAEDASGRPGPIIHTEIVTPADYAAAGYTGSDFFGTFMMTRNLNVVVPGAFWIIIEPDTPLREEGIRYVMNLVSDGSGPLVAGTPGLAVFDFGVFGPPQWYYAGPEFFGTNADGALDLKAQVCCVPFDGRTCLPPDLWTTQSHDFGRTGASNMSIDDAWCDLTTSWLYETPANSIPNMSPIVHNGRVYISTSSPSGDASTIEILDLITGANLFTISDPDFGNFILNDPTIIGDLLYVSGGDKRTITVWDISSVPTKVMSRSFGGAVGPLRFANTIVLNVGGSDVIFAGSEVGRVVAIDAVTGADYGGWASNPLTLTAGQRIGGAASDGVSLYYVTRIGGLNGDVFAVDATTGTINWQLSSAGGLQGISVYGSDSPITPISEGFTNVSYDADKLFVGSRMTGDFPRDGVYYTLNAASGSLINRIATNGFIFSNPIVDINLVYLQTFSRWIGGNPTLGNNLIAVSKNTGGQAWQSEDIYENLDDMIFRGHGVLSCEPEPVADIIINTDNEGGINFWHSLTGEQLFRRRWDYGQNISDGASATLAADNTGATHVLVSNGFGAVVDLVKGADRPRLEIQDYDPQIAVDFSVDLSVIKTVAGALVNSGCTDLTFTNVNVSTVSNGSSDPSIVSINVIRPDLLDRSTDLANVLASSARFFKGLYEETGVELDVEQSLVSFREPVQNNDRFLSRSATSSHPFLNGVTQPVSGQVLAAGDTLDVVIDVNASEILRGPQIFYIELDTDDPDFFVNAGGGFLPSLFPEIKVTLVGGCLTDSTSLTFGIGAANTQIEWNAGTLTNNEAFSFDIDGDDDAMWLGSYIYGTSQRQLAFTIQYFGGDWTAWQADPNWCDNDCKPALTTGVNLGEMWDGAAYQPIIGNMVCASGIDSVQNHDFGAGWDWDNTPAPFDAAATMGLKVNTRTFAVPDVAALSQFTLEIFDFTERNGVPVPGWKFGFWCDYDTYFGSPAGDKDTMLMDPSNSVVWSATNAGTGTAFGAVKVPFGCGYAPAKNVWTLDSDESFYGTTSGLYLDLFYSYASGGTGEFSMPNAVAGRDQSMHATLAEHDFAANGTYSLGVAIFGLHDLADSWGPSLQAPAEIATIANFVNKWAGFSRGDVDNDNNITIADIMTIVGIVSGSVPGAIPFEHLADVNGDSAVDAADVTYLVDYYFNAGPCPVGNWTL